MSLLSRANHDGCGRDAPTATASPAARRQRAARNTKRVQRSLAHAHTHTHTSARALAQPLPPTWIDGQTRLHVSAARGAGVGVAVAELEWPSVRRDSLDPHARGRVLRHRERVGRARHHADEEGRARARRRGLWVTGILLRRGGGVAAVATAAVLPPQRASERAAEHKRDGVLFVDVGPSEYAVPHVEFFSIVRVQHAAAARRRAAVVRGRLRRELSRRRRLGVLLGDRDHCRCGGIVVRRAIVGRVRRRRGGARRRVGRRGGCAHGRQRFAAGRGGGRRPLFRSLLRREALDGRPVAWLRSWLFRRLLLLVLPPRGREQLVLLHLAILRKLRKHRLVPPVAAHGLARVCVELLREVDRQLNAGARPHRCGTSGAKADRMADRNGARPKSEEAQSAGSRSFLLWWWCVTQFNLAVTLPAALLVGFLFVGGDASW